MTDELKPCPFCGGGKDRSWHISVQEPYTDVFVATARHVCPVSEIEIKFYVKGNSRDDVRKKIIEEWNRRTI